MIYMPFIKVIIASIVVAFSSWLSHKKPELAGFIVALPLVSILALLFSYVEFKDAAATSTFAKSILVGAPISYLFFLPFFFMDRFQMNFWMTYFSGLLLLVIGFFIHQAILGWIK